MAETFSQVASLLFPFYRDDMEQESHLGSYRQGHMEALKSVASICKVLDPSVLAKESDSAQTDTSSGSGDLLTDAFSSKRGLCSTLSFSQKLIREFTLYEMMEVQHPRACPLDFWKMQCKLPILSSISRMVLTRPVTSTPSERVFSAAGRVLDTRRARLLPENLELLLKVGHFHRITGKIPGFIEYA